MSGTGKRAGKRRRFSASKFQRPPADLQLAIMTGDQAVLVSIPGIGKKLAERVVFELKEKVAEANLAELRRYAPNLTDDVILASHVKSPLDLERFNAHNWHGSCHGGDMGPAQSGALRPAPGWAGHRTPIPGLYQTGATTHPGGSVSAAPGRNAAMVVLRDLGFRPEEGLAGA